MSPPQNKSPIPANGKAAKPKSKFTIIPLAVFSDKRLSLNQLRVLGVLYSFASTGKFTVWPKRKTIAALCGLHIVNVSAATTALEKLGWITKFGTGGRSRAVRYKLTPLETVALKCTVSEGGNTVAAETRGIEVTNKGRRSSQKYVLAISGHGDGSSECVDEYLLDQDFTDDDFAGESE